MTYDVLIIVCDHCKVVTMPPEMPREYHYADGTPVYAWTCVVCGYHKFTKVAL